LKKTLPTAGDGDDDNVRSINSFEGSFFGVGKQGFTIEQAVTELETQMIVDALRRHDWNISRTAKELGLTRRGLYMKIERYGIERAA
jgi:DNA-binding NtrC family response regulator